MVVMLLASGDSFAYEQALGLALTVADLAEDYADDGAAERADAPTLPGVAPVGVVVVLERAPLGSEAERTCKRLKQLELYGVPCYGPTALSAALPFITVRSSLELSQLVQELAAQHATVLRY